MVETDGMIFERLSDREKITYLLKRLNQNRNELSLQKQTLRENKTELDKFRNAKKASVEKNIKFGRGRRKTNSTGFAHVRLSREELSDLYRILYQYLDGFRLKGITSEYTQKLHRLKRKIESNRNRVWQFDYVVQDKGFETEHLVAVKHSPKEQQTEPKVVAEPEVVVAEKKGEAQDGFANRVGEMLKEAETYIKDDSE